LLALLVAPLHAALDQQGDVTFSNVPCHLAFAYPSTWEVVRDTVDPQSDCNFLIRPKDREQRLVAHDSVDFFTISLRGLTGNPATVAPENGFERRGSRWVLLGETNQPADTISGPGWSGWHGLTASRCYKVDGPYAGQCAMPTALVGTTNRSVLLVAGPQSQDVFDGILRTLRLEFTDERITPRHG